MIDRILPLKIKEKIQNLKYTVDKIGLSDSIVYIFDDYILKVMTNTLEARNEISVLNVLSKKLPVANIIECELVGDEIFVLYNKIKGNLLCDKEYLNNKELLLDVSVKALNKLWDTEIKSKKLLKMLDVKLSIIENNIKNQKIFYRDVNDEYKEKFKSLEEMYNYLIENKPEEELVLSHGDFCLPNVIVDKDNLIGYIDLGFFGLSDKYQDIATLYRSLKYNFNGYYDGITYPGYEDNMLFDKLKIKRDDNKLNYYLLLDELMM